MGGPDPGRHERASFNKRNRTMFRKAHELATLCGANVYVFIDHPRATTVYNSVENAHWPLPDELLEDRYPDLQRLHTSSMAGGCGRGRALKSPARQMRRMRAAGLNRCQSVTRTKVTRKSGKSRKPRQRRQPTDSESETMALTPLPSRLDSKQHSESGYSDISHPMDISQPSRICLPQSQNSPANDKQSDNNVEDTYGPDYPRIPVTELLNQ